MDNPRPANQQPRRNIISDLGPVLPKPFTVQSQVPTPAQINIENYRCIGSYNWVDCDEPTILIPGSPRLWKEPTLPLTVPHDEGYQFCDQNGWRLPETPLLPIMLAVPPSENFAWSEVDFVTDRNNLRKLLGWVQGLKEPFRIDLELAGEKTVLMNRWEERTRMKASFNSFGASFEDAASVAAVGCETSAAGNHRIAAYDMGGIRMVVRFEVDACVHDTVDELVVDTARLNIGLSHDPDEVSSSDSDAATPTSPSLIRVRKAGTPVPDTSIVEIISKKKGVVGGWKKRYEQMFFAQTPAVYVGTHENGRFTQIVKKTLKELEYVKDNLQPQLKQLCAVLGEIQCLAKEEGKAKKLSVVCQNKELHAYKRLVDDSCLPDPYLAYFAHKVV